MRTVFIIYFGRLLVVRGTFDGYSILVISVMRVKHQLKPRQEGVYSGDSSSHASEQNAVVSANDLPFVSVSLSTCTPVTSANVLECGSSSGFAVGASGEGTPGSNLDNRHQTPGE